MRKDLIYSCETEILQYSAYVWSDFRYLQKWGVGEVYTGRILASFLSVGVGMGWGQRFRMQMTLLTLTIRVAWLIKQ